MSYSITGNPFNSIYTIAGSNGTSSAAGQTLSVSSGGTVNWGTLATSTSLSGNDLSIKGDADISGDLKVKGKSIVDSLERIEERLAILYPNEELEEKWENLRGLRKAYIELEKEIKEKEQIWATLKK